MVGNLKKIFGIGIFCFAIIGALILYNTSAHISRTFLSVEARGTEVGKPRSVTSQAASTAKAKTLTPTPSADNSSEPAITRATRIQEHQLRQWHHEHGLPYFELANRREVARGLNAMRVKQALTHRYQVHFDRYVKPSDLIVLANKLRVDSSIIEAFQAHRQAHTYSKPYRLSADATNLNFSTKQTAAKQSQSNAQMVYQKNLLINAVITALLNSRYPTI